MTFNGQPFMKKEAANLQPMWKVIKETAKNIHPNMIPRNSKRANQSGLFAPKPADSVVKPVNARFYNESEVSSKALDEVKKGGTGAALTADPILGLTKLIVPKTREPIENAVAKFKQGTENIDTKLGALAAGKNANSFRGRMFSEKAKREVGQEFHADGTTSPLFKEDRRPSIVEPIQSTTRFLAPILGATYVADKLYPSEEGDTRNDATYGNEIQKQSSVQEPVELFDKSVLAEMDKLASMQKVADLEIAIEKIAEERDDAVLEKEAALDKLGEVLREKEEIEKRASFAEKNLLEKKAEHEELRLRTIARERSKVAVELADSLLVGGLIKQAQVEETVDMLMECDERTIKIHQNLVKEAKKQEESLESLAILGEYKGNGKLVVSSKDQATHGLSKKGQSIGEAASDLNKK